MRRTKILEKRRAGISLDIREMIESRFMLIDRMHEMKENSQKPNPETLAAIEEAKAGLLQGPLDVSSLEAMYKSLGL